MTGPTFTVDSALVLTNASTIFTALAAIAALVMGFKLGVKLLRRVVGLV